MRQKRQASLLSVLAVAFVTLLVLPITAAAASGLPATVTMQPDAAGPGAEVQIVGIDFPGDQGVELQLTTTAGPVLLGTTTTEPGGYFRQTVTLPTDVAPGFWELRATGANGTVAVHIFEAGAAAPVAAAEVPQAEVAVPASGGPSGANLLVVLVVLLIIGGIGGSAAIVYYQMHRPEGDPGMSTGDDPIWANASSDNLTRDSLTSDV